MNLELDYSDDFNENASIQTSNTDLNNQLASWQQKTDDTEILFQIDCNSESKDRINTSVCHVAIGQ